MDDSQRWDEQPGQAKGKYVFLEQSQDSDYNGTAILTFTNEKTIKHLTFGNRYGRIRVRLTALTGSNVALRVL